MYWTFQALVDAVIPRTPNLAKVYGEIMFYGALDLQTDKFLIMSLNNYYIPLAKPTAEILDLVSERFIALEENKEFLNARYIGEGIFAVLSPDNRFRTLTLLAGLDFDLYELMMLFGEYAAFILVIANDLNRLTMMGYYSEWFGYGSTRLNSPDQRTLEFSPLSWTQTGYPGPSFSYRNEVIEYYKRRAEHE